MKKILTFALILNCLSTLVAQGIPQDDLGANNLNLQAAKGSYEIILDSTKGNDIVEMTSNILTLIEENRQEYAYAYINLAPSIKVKIYPRRQNSVNTINSAKDGK